jgi:sugar phosphate permease
MNALIISLYIGYAIYYVFRTYFPFAAQVFALGGTDAMRTIVAIVVYVIAVGISHFLLRRLGYGHHGRKGLPMIVLGLLVLGFLIALGYQVFAITHLIILPPLIAEVFGPAQYFFWWFTAPIVGLFFLV